MDTRPGQGWHAQGFADGRAAAVLCCWPGGWLRYSGLNWDDFTFLHPDERFLTDVASSIGGRLQSTEADDTARSAHVARCQEHYPQSGGAGPYFDAACSTLNPHNVGKGIYVYGTLPLFLARATGELLAQVSGDPYARQLLWPSPGLARSSRRWRKPPPFSSFSSSA